MREDFKAVRTRDHHHGVGAAIIGQRQRRRETLSMCLRNRLIWKSDECRKRVYERRFLKYGSSGGRGIYDGLMNGLTNSGFAA